MSPHEPILIICHSFPPVPGIGGRRWAKFAKELARRGHPVHVIRAQKQPDTADSLWHEDGATPGIIHHPLPRRYPAVITRPVVRSLKDKLLYRAWKKLLPLLCTGNWFDSTILWRGQLLHKAGQLVREHGIRQVVVSGAPFRLMAYGAELKQQFPQIHLVVDLRDEWTSAGHYGLASMPPARIAQEKDFEARVVNRADNVISPHTTVLDHLRGTNSGSSARFTHIPHAVDPDDFDLSIKPVADGRFKMIYAGSMYGEGEAKAYFTEMLKALQTVCDSRPDAFGKFQFDLYITGHDTRWYEQQIEARGWQDRIVFHRPLPPHEVFIRVPRSDLVMLFIPQVNKDILGTKFQEIFFTGTPILHVGEQGLVSSTILEKHMGSSLRVEELASELPRIISGERKVECDRNADHSAYLLPNVVDRLLSEVLV